jgi:hypothetical protein
MMRLKTRPHPQNSSKVQYRYVANDGRWVWGPRAVRKAPGAACWRCGATVDFVQDDYGVVRAYCRGCDNSWAEWWPSQAYERRRDSGAGWRRALRAV